MTCKRTYSDTAASVEEKISLTTPAFVKLPPRTGKFNKQKFDYFLVLDFEATCDSPKTLVPQEVIEFPVLKINSGTFETESMFHSYVKPVINPELTKFCTQLTGITQEMVDNQPIFEDVFEKFQRWMQEEKLLDKNTKIAFVTVGDWDLKYLFPIQCKGLRIPVADYMRSWINLKVSFAEMTTVYPRNMITMMKYCQLEHEGRLHSGLDDCKNIARVLRDLAERGLVYELNGGLVKRG
ncbi:ERI1 exoribonuclease 3 like protein [Argiope bruennichi]|uniref:ERI1 exoribonuclease 3 like protein n=1 Tax=Argiope bruennichi TaxID=94029 RepID=A0A8T0FA09_ARGBR|nr:ERI1 exoribonuclease 3 like protein [Argiope bruennichi]